MSGFHEVRFPLRLAIGASGGPERRTEIITLASGQEVRNAVWRNSRRRWDVGGAVSDMASLQVLAAFFEARMGRLYGFRFRDPMDYSSALPGTDSTPLDQILGVGDDVTAEFQLQKDYGGTTRDIVKPVEGCVRVAIDDIEQSTGWSIDHTTGVLTFDVAPEDGAIVSAGFEFDCAVRFDTDRLEGVIEGFDAGRLVSVGLLELDASSA